MMWIVLQCLSLLSAAPALAQTRGVPESGLITWPVFPSGPIREVPGDAGATPRLLAELSTKNVYIRDVGRSRDDRLIVADYEVSDLRLSLGWEPEGPLGAGGGRLEANLTGRVMWGGFLDPIIQGHHTITGLPNAGRETRPWGSTLLAIAPDVDGASKIDYYPDEEFIDEAILSARSSRGSLSLGASYSRDVLLPGVRLFLSSGTSTLPRMSSAIESGGALTGHLTGGISVQRQPSDWLRISGQADVSGMAVVGAGGWRSLLDRHVLVQGAARLDLLLDTVTLATVASVRRSPAAIAYYRIGDASVSLDIAAHIPFRALPGHQLVLAFVQDFPPGYVAPDFGINLGVVTPLR